MPREIKAASATGATPGAGSATRPKKPATVPLPSPATTQNTASLEEEIRRRAYELYEQRGRQDGMAEEDWLRAETEVLGRRGARTA